MTNPSKIRVMVIDDHPVIRSGLTAFLRVVPDMELAGEAASGQRALAMLTQAAPDVILMDMMMPEMNGVAATAAILARDPSIRILILTSYKEENMVQEALRIYGAGDNPGAEANMAKMLAAAIEAYFESPFTIQ